MVKILENNMPEIIELCKKHKANYFIFLAGPLTQNIVEQKVILTK